jgi:hypothetical protein
MPSESVNDAATLRLEALVTCENGLRGSAAAEGAGRWGEDAEVDCPLPKWRTTGREGGNPHDRSDSVGGR